jgi:beta-mannosidase
MLMHNQVKQLFGEVPTNMEDYITASQLSQAEAKKYFVEKMRCQMARNGGVIWWNLVDGWPQMSDAIVDYYYDKKLAYNYIKRSQYPVMIMIDELNNWGQNIVSCNSTLSSHSGSYRVYDIDTDETLASGDFRCEPNSNGVIKKLPAMYADKRMLIIEWTVGGKTYFNTYLCGTPAIDFAKYKVWLEKIAVLEEKYMN